MFSFSQALTTLLICRLVLNLRTQSCHSRPRDASDGPGIPPHVFEPRTTGSRLEMLTSLAAIATFFDVHRDDHGAVDVRRALPPVVDLNSESATLG
jgi:hypothetical protein